MVPELQVSGNLKGQSSLDALKSPRNEAVIKLGELGVFRRDKLVGWLNGEESRGVAWLSNRVKNLIIVYPCSAKGGERDSLSSFRVLKSSTKLSSEIQGGKVTMKVQINARGVLDETGCKMDLSNPRVIAEQQRIIAKEINGEVVSTWNRLRTIETDAPGFLDVIHREHPDAWKKLAQSKHPLDEITIRPQIRVNIEHTDMINKPYSTLLEQNKRP
jgi:spore germination protein KC